MRDLKPMTQLRDKEIRVLIQPVKNRIHVNQFMRQVTQACYLFTHKVLLQDMTRLHCA